MLFDLFTSEDPRMALISLLLSLPAILIALTFHEVAHGWVSYKQGDPTAYNLGRLTLNPMKHLDPIGTLAMLIVGIGWAKPVPVNSRYYKKPKVGMALTALAGPVMNLILAFIGALVASLTKHILFSTLLITTEAVFNIVYIIYIFFWNFASLNAYLAIFNLLPIPPFDGSRIAFIFLPTEWYFKIMRHERVIMLVVMALLLTGAMTGGLSTVTNWVLTGIYWVTDSLMGLIF